MDALYLTAIRIKKHRKRQRHGGIGDDRRKGHDGVAVVEPQMCQAAEIFLREDGGDPVRGLRRKVEVDEHEFDIVDR